VLSAIHNVHFYLVMMAEIRQAIADDRFMAYKHGFLNEYLSNATSESPRKPRERSR